MNVQSLKARIDCRELLASDLGEPARKSGVWQWPCVFHADGRTPSLTAWPDGWRCFACGKHGDAITWVMERRGVGFRDAVAMLGGELAPLSERTPAGEHVRSAPLREPPPKEWQESAVHFTHEAHACLLSDAGKRARSWLNARGITDDDIALWHLGYVPADRKDRWGGMDVYLPRGIVIPAFVGGLPWYVKIRRPVGDPKYLHVKGGRPALYGADLLAGKPDLLLVEGEFDCCLMRRLVGSVLDAATFGSASDKDIRLWLPVLVNYQRIFVGFDSDDAGDRARHEWYARTKRAHGLFVPVGKDWTEAWQKLGDDELRRFVLDCVGV